jgi:putative transposase
MIFRNGDGILTRSTYASTESFIISGAPLIPPNQHLRGEVLEVFVTKTRDRKAALRFLKKVMKRYGRPKSIVIDRLRSYRAALNEIGNAALQMVRRWLNNRAENSYQLFRRRERAMAKFRNTKTLQKFAAIHASIHNHFNQERHLYNRDNFKNNRNTALADWRQLTV